MPYTQSFDQLLTAFVLLASGIYLLRAVVGVALLLVGTIPSKLGARARAAGARVTPRLVMKIVSTLTGVLVAGTGIGATTAFAAPATPAVATKADAQKQLPALDRGPSGPTKSQAPAKDHGSAKSKQQSTTNQNTKKSQAAKANQLEKANQQTKARQPDNAKVPARHGAKSNNQSKPNLASGTTVTVRSGDSLWSLAHSQLGPQATDQEIDREWRRWYQVNKKVVGSDPNLIIPGMKLAVPSS